MKKIFLLLFLLLPLFSTAQYNISFHMEQLWCDQTTEAGEDEIYLHVVYRGSDGSYLNSIFGPWDMNDGNEPRSVDKWVLLRTNLTTGQYGTITVSIMEQDGGDLNQWKKVGDKILATCNHPKCLVAQQVSNWVEQSGFNIIDSDDYIGSFSITFGYDQYGKFYFNRENLERYYKEEPWGSTGLRLFFSGDGSNYNGYFYFGNGK